MNSFLQLRDEEVRSFVDQRQDKVRQQVESRIETYHFIGDVLELFFPMMADTLTVMAGGDVSYPDTDYLTIEEGGYIEGGKKNPGPPLPPGPEDRDEIIR